MLCPLTSCLPACRLSVALPRLPACPPTIPPTHPPTPCSPASRSFAEAQAKRQQLELAYEFVDSPQLGAAEWREARQYDVVTCMFALHYFFVTEQALKQVRGGGAACRAGLGCVQGGGGGECAAVQSEALHCTPAVHPRLDLPCLRLCLLWPLLRLLCPLLRLLRRAVPAQCVHQPEGGRLLHWHSARRQAHQRLHPQVSARPERSHCCPPTCPALLCHCLHASCCLQCNRPTV